MAYKPPLGQDYDPSNYAPWKPPTGAPVTSAQPHSNNAGGPDVGDEGSAGTPEGAGQLWAIAQQIAQFPSQQAAGNANSGGGGGSAPAPQLSGWQAAQYNVPTPPGGYFTNWNASAPRLGAAPQSNIMLGPGQIGQTSPYQATQFSQRSVAPTMDNAIQPGNLDQYSAGAVRQFAPSGSADPLNAIAQQLAQAFSQNAMPDMAGMQEQQKEQLLALKAASMENAQQNAAGRGTLGGGALMGLEGRINDAFAGDLTKSYRDIAFQGQQQGFNNQLAGAQAAGNLAAQLAATEQGNYTTGLAGTALQEQLRQAQANNSLARAQYGLDFSGQQFGQNLASQQFGAGQEQAQSAENALAAQLAMQRANSIDQNALQSAQFGLNQNNANAQNTLGYANYNLGAQGFELGAQNAGLAEYLGRLGVAQNADQIAAGREATSASSAAANRGYDLQEIGLEQQGQKDMLGFYQWAWENGLI